MKQLYPLLAVLALTMASAKAQDFRPFRMGTVYQYNESATPGDTTHTLQLTSASKVGTDSVFRFNGRAVKPRSIAIGCYNLRVVRPDNLFGMTLTKRANSEYVLTASNGRTFTLKPNEPLNQPWQAVPGGVTAQVTMRSVIQAYGITQNAVTITLSDGKTLLLSEKLGLLEGPALGSYLNGQRARQLTLTALPTLHLGVDKTGPTAVHDYQPGDVFLRYSKTEGYTTGLCSESWQRDSVLTRTLSTNGDTIKYTIWSRTLSKQRGGMPSAPPGFSCPGTAGTYLSPSGVTTLKVARSSGMTEPVTLTGTVWSYSAPVPNMLVTLGANYYRASTYNNRVMSSDIQQQVCLGAISTDSLRMGDIVDGGRLRVYGNGLGLVSSSSADIYYMYTTTLLGYRKVLLPTSTGVEQWGSLRTFAQILKAADYKPAATTAAFPNPFTQELTVKFEAARAQPVQVRLYNALGQLVHERQQAATVGSQLLQLQLPTLPASLYTLHLAHDGRTEVLRVVKSE